MATTIKEVASKANVSIATVSRALNDGSKVRPSTKESILIIAEKLNYKPNIIARNLVKKNTSIIGLVLPEIQGDFFTDIIKGVDEVAYSSKYHIIVASSHSERPVVESLMNFMGRSMVDGVIIMSPLINDRIKEIIKKSDTPLVIIDCVSPIENVDTVNIDNFQGAYAITEYLIKNLGYKKVAHVEGPANNNDAIQRKAGYIEALYKNNIPIKQEWIVPGGFTSDGGRLACSRLLSLIEKPEVIFAGNDMMAAGCYKAIDSLGFKVPDDIGVAGFDDIFLSEFLTPRLTTVHIPIIEIGKSAARLLINKIKNGKDHKPKHLKVSTGIIVGESCKFQK